MLSTIFNNNINISYFNVDYSIWRILNMITSFPKIFALGNRHILDIFDGEVEITEKIDGSQFCYGKINNQIHFRSRGSVIYPEKMDKMFSGAVEHILSKQDKLPNGIVFYSENLQKPKHNVLAYNRTPKNHIALFGAMNYITKEMIFDYHKYANILDIETVPVLYKGKIESPEELEKLLNTDSILGGSKIEGVVVKNYAKSVLLAGTNVILSLMSGKYVSEKFKEKHQKNWKKDHTKVGGLELLKSSLRTKARWHKAVQHLRDSELLEQDPRDIGKLVKEVQNDIEAEEKEYIMEKLYAIFKGEILRNSIRGLPEWYKAKLLENVEFKEEQNG